MLQAQTHQTAKKFKLHAKIHASSPHENPMPTRSFLLSRQILTRTDAMNADAISSFFERRLLRFGCLFGDRLSASGLLLVGFFIA
jgi:hypothetical protein